jgi:glucose dehydrogenase
MPKNNAISSALLATSVLALSSPALAADVTPQRLANPEPQNWLMNHRTYDGQRFSPLARINKDNVKSLKLAYAVPLGGGAGNDPSSAGQRAPPVPAARRAAACGSEPQPRCRGRAATR